MKTEQKLKKMGTFLESLSGEKTPEIEPIKKAFAICFENSILDGINSEVKNMKIDWNKYKDPMIQNGVKLMKEINDAGFEAYVVGGAVRDILMGDPNPHDIDIASNIPIEEIKKRYRTIEYGGGEKHGTVIVRYNKEDYEITQFRTDGDYGDGRRPDDVKFVQSFEEDSKRRDFTINAMGIDAAGKVIDYHGGAEDIKAKKLRTVGDPTERFGEDALRMLRAVRFAARFDFNVDDKVVDAIKNMKESVNTTSIERVRDELWKTMEYGGKKFGSALQFMKDTGLFTTILPEITLTDEKIASINKVNTQDPVINFAILMNDMRSGDVQKLGSRITMSNPEKRSVGVIVNGLIAYTQLDKIHKDVAMKIVMHPDFPKIRKTYIAINDQDVPGVDGMIEKYTEIAAIQKGINQIIGSKGIKGQDFSAMIRKVDTWLFDNFEKGNLPELNVIEQFIEKQK